MADLAREALNLILEFSLVEMWDAGYRLKDLGFTKYTTHQVHYYGNGVVTTKPTCVSSGVMTYTCKICRDKITDTIAPTGVHTWKLVDIFDPGFEDETGYVHHGFASYACKYCSATKNADLCAEVIFTDMPARDNYAHNPIDWAYFGGITAGTSDTTFSPNKGCTRAQVVTFLWRAAGEPAPQQTDNPFTDVKAGQYYYDAVLWAVENGISLGTSSTTFSPDKTCTRAQIVTFLWRFEACPEAVNTVNPFRDVTGADYFYSAVLWAAETGVTTGTSDYEFSPAKTCTRAQVVTFLYRDSRLAPAESEEPQEPEDPVDPSVDELEPLGLPLPEEVAAEAAAEPKADEAEPEEAEAAGEAGELTTSAAAFTLSRTRSIDPPTELRPLASADLQALLELLEALKP